MDLTINVLVFVLGFILGTIVSIKEYAKLADEHKKLYDLYADLVTDYEKILDGKND